MLTDDGWQLIGMAGVLLGVAAGIAGGPWTAAMFTVIYGAAVLSILEAS